MDLRLKIFVLLLIASLMVTGCNGAREIDDYAYVLSIGIDPGPGDQYVITYRIATGKSAGAKEGEAEQTSILISVVAPSLDEARSWLNSVIARTPNLSHTKVVVIGEELARRGLGDILGPLLRFREFRGSMFITVVQGSAREAMEKNKPQMESLPSRWLETILASRRDSGYFLASNLHQFYLRLKAPGGAPYATYMALNPLDLKPKPANQKVAGGKAPEYYAGGLGRSGGNSVEAIGTAVFVADKMVGLLTDEESRAVSILSNDFVRGAITVTDPLLPEHGININLRLGKKPSIKPHLADGTVIFDVNVLLEGEITRIPSNINYENKEYVPILEQHLSEILTKQMEKTLLRTQQMGADVAGFGLYTRSLFDNFNDYDRLDWYKLYPMAKFNLNVKVEVRRTGLMYKSSPFKRTDNQ